MNPNNVWFNNKKVVLNYFLKYAQGWIFMLISGIGIELTGNPFFFYIPTSIFGWIFWLLYWFVFIGLIIISIIKTYSKSKEEYDSSYAAKFEWFFVAAFKLLYEILRGTSNENN